jgi:hypothetical protein
MSPWQILENASRTVPTRSTIFGGLDKKIYNINIECALSSQTVCSDQFLFLNSEEHPAFYNYTEVLTVRA